MLNEYIKILPCMLFCEFDMLIYVAVSQVGLEMQVSYSHITLLPLQNYNMSGYLMIAFILAITCNISLSVILSTGTFSNFYFLIGISAMAQP